MMKDDINNLSASGLRVTNQRMLILDIIRRKKGHLDAEEVYRLAKRRYPRISLSTVYRNLRVLKELGLIDEHHFEDAHHHYEVKSNIAHNHLICTICGKVVEFEYQPDQQVLSEISHGTGFQITGSEMRMRGICPECQSQ